MKQLNEYNAERDYQVSKIDSVSRSIKATAQAVFTCSKLTIKTLEQGVSIVNFEHISHFILVFNFELVNASWRFTDVLQSICSEMFRKVLRKVPT